MVEKPAREEEMAERGGPPEGERREPRPEARGEGGPHGLDQVDELERLRSPERDWVAPLEEEERKAATRDPRTPPARLEPYPGGERGDEAASDE